MRLPNSHESTLSCLDTARAQHVDATDLSAPTGQDGAASSIPSGCVPMHTTIHQAIDYLTAALLDVQHIRRATEETAISGELDEQLHRLEGTLQRLGNCLLDIRGEPR